MELIRLQIKANFVSGLKMKIHQNRVTAFQKNILHWYNKNGREFPWRRSGLSNYKLIIAEILLQRTKAETISKFYDKFLAYYPSWKSIDKTRKTNLEKKLKPIGLYKQRANLLKKLAREMTRRNGRLPSTRAKIEELPFAGQYMVNAIFLVIKNQNAPLLDMNMARVLERYFGPRKLSDIRYDPYLQNLAWRVVDHNESKKINWGILDFAALVCLARNPKCEICPLNNKCNYFNNKGS